MKWEGHNCLWDRNLLSKGKRLLDKGSPDSHHDLSVSLLTWRLISKGVITFTRIQFQLKRILSTSYYWLSRGGSSLYESWWRKDPTICCWLTLRQWSMLSWVLPLVLGLDAWVFSLHLQTYSLKGKDSWIKDHRTLKRRLTVYWRSKNGKGEREKERCELTARCIQRRVVQKTSQEKHSIREPRLSDKGRKIPKPIKTAPINP